MTEASAGLKTSNVLPDAAGTHLPPIKFNFGRFSQLATRELIPGVARLDGLWPPLGPVSPTLECWSVDAPMRSGGCLHRIGIEYVLVENLRFF
jgi:hypothetical protein